MAAKVRKISETRINKNRYEKNTDKHPTFFSNNNPLSHPSPQSQFSQLSQFSQPLPAIPVLPVLPALPPLPAIPALPAPPQKH